LAPGLEDGYRAQDFCKTMIRPDRKKCPEMVVLEEEQDEEEEAV
jgi:hypothetical protein